MTFSTHRLEQMFESAETSTTDADDKSTRARDYYDGNQLTTKELSTLKKRKQPPVISNRIKPKIDALIGIEIESRTDPKALPRNPNTEEGAVAVTKALRYIVDNTRYDIKRSAAYENLIIEGIGIGEWSIKILPNGDKEIVFTQIQWDRYFYDPVSSRPDFSDVTFNGIAIWMDVEKAKVKWPKKAKDFDAAASSGETTTRKFDDKPVNVFFDATRKRIRIIKMYYLEKGKWMVATFAKSVEIENKEVVFVDENGESINPLVAMSAFVDRENGRYGQVNQMLSPQDEINKRRSKLLHMLSVRQIRVNRNVEAAKKINTIKSELAKPDGVIVANADEFEILSQNDQISGQAALLQEAKDEIDAVGVNPSLQGKSGGDLSGRAIIAQQSAGALEIRGLNDRKRDWDLRNYTVAYYMMRQFWTDPKWIRIINDEKIPEFVGLNQPVTAEEQLARELEEMSEEDQALAAQVLEGLTPEQLQDIVATDNNLAEINVDIVITEGQDIATIKSEQFDALAQSGVLSALPLEIVLEFMPNINEDTKERILDKANQKEDPAAQEIQQRLLALEIAAKEADVEKTQSETAENLSQVEKNLADANSSTG